MIKRVILLVVVLVNLGVLGAQAAGPEDFFYGLSQCTGYDVAQLVTKRAQFDNWYAKQHPGLNWELTYLARMNEFAATLGCKAAFREDPSGAPQLEVPYRIYAEYHRDIYTAE